MELPPETLRERLDRALVARLATVAPDGRPQQVPIVFARTGEELWSPVDGKPKSGGELARVAHVRERPEVSLLVDEYTSDWDQLWWIRVDATARVAFADDPDFEAACSALREKYPQYASVPLTRDPPTLLAFRPRRIRSWSA